MKIFIDAGHGGVDSGAVGVLGRQEKDDNLRMALALGNKLTSLGFEVMQSRNNDVAVSLDARVTKANNWGADLFLCIHRNAYSDPNSNGIEDYTYTQVSNNTTDWANIIQSCLTKVYAQSNRGVKTDNFYVLRNTTMPAVLIELGFVTNATDNAMFDKYFDDYVNALANTISLKFGVSNTPKTKYQIILGDFTSQDEATKVLQIIKNVGIIGEIKEIPQ